MQRGILLLEDGAWWSGVLHCATATAYGEAVFNTAMTGYEEVLTDPSYCGQVVTFTAPHIGNTGITEDDAESGRAHATAVVVRELTATPSSWRSRKPLPEWLAERGIPVLDGVDTRAVVKHLRQRGAMRCMVGAVPDGELATLAPHLERLREQPGMQGAALVWQVTRQEPERIPGTGPRVVVYDFGCKQGILTELTERGHEVVIVPAGTSAREALAFDPAGVLLSNGPGDPAATPEIAREVRALVESRIPVFGICLGHQLLALALGARTRKLKFGHRGANHPVKDLGTQKVEITSHNHGFEVVEDSLPPDVTVTHRDLYDGCVEGLQHVELPVFSVQYHPESRPGPRDSSYLFERFATLLRTRVPEAV